MHIFVEIWYMDHGLNIEKNETIKILRPGSYWQEFTVFRQYLKAFIRERAPTGIPRNISQGLNSIFLFSASVNPGKFCMFEYFFYMSIRFFLVDYWNNQKKQA